MSDVLEEQPVKVPFMGMEHEAGCLINTCPSALKPGDRVRTNRIPDERHMVRTLLSVTPSEEAEGGLASADGGEGGTPITDVAAAWFIRVSEEEQPR